MVKKATAKYRIEEIKAVKIKPKDRRMILDEDLRPLILSDDKEYYWDGQTVIYSNIKSLRGATIWIIYNNKEMQIMAKEGLFWEAIGAWIDECKYSRLFSIVTGSPGISNRKVSIPYTEESGKAEDWMMGGRLSVGQLGGRYLFDYRELAQVLSNKKAPPK
jgi:hypothetical protein